MAAEALLVFSGRFRPASFCDFVDHRARRLKLSASIEAASSGRICIRVRGERDLVDAFEMACSLGPMDCLIEAVERREGP